MAKVTLQNVKMGYTKRKLAVDGVTLTVESGEFFVLLGPSGCGKTSLLRLISGISKPSEGDVLFDDRSVKDVITQDRNVAMVFQNFALYPHMSVYRNIAYPLESRKMPKDEIDRKVREIAAVFGISGLLDRRPRVLSGGQRQLVAIARAMVREPAVFLLDEPFANLDAELRDVLRAQVRKAHRLMPETTFIYVTHDLREAMSISDRMAIMKDGKIMASGTAADIYMHPPNVYAAEFLGYPKINLFPAEIFGDAWKFIVPKYGSVNPDASDSGADNPGAYNAGKCNAAGTTGKQLLFGIRPEHLVIAENSPPGTGEPETEKKSFRTGEPEAGEIKPEGIKNSFVLEIKGRFEGLARAGTGIQVLFTVDGLSGTFSSLASENIPERTGDPIRFAVNKEFIQVFDRKSGRNISADGYEAVVETRGGNF